MDAAELAGQRAERRQTVQRSRLDRMRNFADTERCRGQALLAYFGEHLPEPCGHCDNCHEQPATVDDAGEGPFPLHSAVRHTEWGEGAVLNYTGDQMLVLFDEVGYKTLSVPVVEEGDLLAPA